LGLARHAFDVAEKKARKVEQVNSDIENRIALRLMQIGLNGVDIVASAKGDTSPGSFTDGAAVDHSLQLAHGRLPAEVLMDRKSHACPAGGLDDFARLIPVGP